jgi:NADP-reducing hydrogenase subunit HndC
MILAAFAMGSTRGYFYIRAEYPKAVERVERALVQAREAGLLGQNILGSGFSFDAKIRLGAGAFVCGEETALIASIEGKRGSPSPRPPYPSVKGLWGKPTAINNVETLANVSAIILHGGAWYAKNGTEASRGTKVFAVTGKVKNAQLVEVPMGTTLRQIVFDICGGVLDDKDLKAVQTGGPSGGCLPVQKLDVPVDFDTLVAEGSMMGSGGMIVMDEDTCMVDVARYFLRFLVSESCGNCTSCREGLIRLHDLLDEIVEGRGSRETIAFIEELCDTVQASSLCALGTSAVNPVLSTLRYFRDEYLAHVDDKRCPAHVCKALITFSIDAELCNGCTLCAQRCPQQAVRGEKKQAHTIEPELCIKCGICKDVCRRDAVLVA